MTDTADKALDALQERLRRIEWGVTGEPCAAGNVDETAALEAAEAITALRAQLADAQAALDAAEIEHGITSNGNLWRFWSKKASDLAKGNTTLRSQLAKAEQHSEKSRALLDIAVAEYERRLATARADALREAADRSTEVMYDEIEPACNSGPIKAVHEAILDLIDTPTPSAPSPEAVARAALEWAAEYIMSQIGLGEGEPWIAGNNSGVMGCRGAIRAAARDPSTLAAIVAKAGGGE
jgi:multidrug efflux pump subunit AcrA (membrane-fusion protein)